MRAQHGISRRHMLAVTAAAGGIAISDGKGRASAQAATRIEKLDPALDNIISTSEPVKEIAAGMGGPMGQTSVVEGRRLSAVRRYPSQQVDEVHPGTRHDPLPGQD
jgi:hypothetical protein